MSVRPAKTQISLGIQADLSLRWAHTHKMNVRPAKTQADLSLRWAHTHFVGFIVSQLIFYFY